MTQTKQKMKFIKEVEYDFYIPFSGYISMVFGVLFMMLGLWHHNILFSSFSGALIIFPLIAAGIVAWLDREETWEEIEECHDPNKL